MTPKAALGSNAIASVGESQYPLSRIWGQQREVRVQDSHHIFLIYSKPIDKPYIVWHSRITNF